MKEFCDVPCKEQPLSANGADLYKIMLELLDRREMLAPLVKEFKIIDSALKNYFRGVPDFKIGKYQIRGFYCESSSLKLPEKVKNKYLKKEKVWIVNINKIKG